ncbi:MAG: DUF1549 and DUF1553 domain-containing protein [Planctomycetes bacterium]|nr:DUF1549 and DUF1553 domain-containing protein [Planctomycetota bacterium]
MSLVAIFSSPVWSAEPTKDTAAKDLGSVSKSSHWAFQPVDLPAIPNVRKDVWVRTPVDAFIAQQHEARGLKPAPEAERRVLVRRLTLDLTGLPPTDREIQITLNDQSADWYEKLFDRLLASPRYGERWGRHWLDLSRWAETEGYESDHPRDFAWRYRDYVVNSFNSDKPYDRFLREQIAGDEIAPSTDENLIATGFLAAARLSSNEEDKYIQRNDVLVDIANTTGSAVLGVTFHCAQCHKHKFDPISDRDYYRFQGFFIKGAPNNLALNDPQSRAKYEAAKPPGYDAARKLKQQIFDATRARLLVDAGKNLSPVERELLNIPSANRTLDQEKQARQTELKLQISDARVERTVASSLYRVIYQELGRRITVMEKTMPIVPQTFGFYSPASGAAKVEVLPLRGFYPPPYKPEELAAARPYLLIAGEVHQRGVPLEVGWPAVFGPTPTEAIEKKPRTALVDWLVRPEHPLTARVWVNRIWQWHFGRGIVETSSDFGTRGSPPTHPALLDWLASELIRSGWSTKHLHRLIVCSNTYRQAAVRHADNVKIDPENTFLWRWSPRRLEAEAVRDSMLAVSQELDFRMGGASDADDSKSLRRTVYLFQKRNKAPEVQKLFDGPGGALESCAKRSVTTVPLQALYMLNHEFTQRRAAVIAERIRTQTGTDRNKGIDLAFRMVLGRDPDTTERTASVRFFEIAAAESKADDPSVLVHFCQSLLNLNEFMYLD